MTLDMRPAASGPRPSAQLMTLMAPPPGLLDGRASTRPNLRPLPLSWLHASTGAREVTYYRFEVRVEPAWVR